jgi:large repetitive protein
MRLRLSLLLLFFTATLHAAVTGIVVTDDGAPLAGARVRAFAREPFSAVAARLLSAAPDPVPLATAESAADGRFSIDAKGNAAVDLVVDIAGREPAAVYAADNEDAGVIALRPSSRARRVRVVADGKPVPNALVYFGHALAARTDAQGLYDASASIGESSFVIHPDFGVGPAMERDRQVQLHRGAALRGRVVARDGTTPVAGATILGAGWPLARSGDDGTFAIAHAPQRAHALLAFGGNDAGSASIDGTKPVTIRLGTAASISGSVTSKGAPVAGATVQLNDDGEIYSAVSDAKGRYAIAALPPGRYNAQANHPAFATARAAEVRAAAGATHAFALAPRVTVRGSVVAEEGKPAAGVFVGGVALSPPSPVVMTNAAGEFTLRLLVSGPTLVAASKIGYATTITPPIALEAGETKSGVKLALQRGFPLQVKVIDPERVPVANASVEIRTDRDTFSMVPLPCSVLDRTKCRTTGAEGTIETRITEGKYDLRVTGDFVPKALPDQTLTAHSSPLVVSVERGAEVSGRVVFSDGTPVADARVTSMPAGVNAATTDANGAFTLKQLPRTPLSLVAMAIDDLGLRSAPVRVTPPSRDVTITFATPARIEGRVVDRTTSQPVTSFNVTATRRESGPMGRGADVNSADGTFVLKRVQPGSVDLRVTAPGYVSGIASDLLVEEGKTLTGVEVKLDRGARVVGHVTANGNAAAGVHVRFGSRARHSGMAETDANGDYVLDGVPAGEQTLDFTKQGLVTKRKTVEVAEGKEARVDADLDRGREIHGRVVDRSGQAIPGARISAHTPTAPYSASATSEDDGKFTVSGLEDGRYNVSAQKNGYVGASVDDVDPAAGRDVTLTLDRGATITGRVTGLAPEELPQVRVSASAHNASASAQSDANGNFTLSGIPDGRITLTAYRPGMPMRQSAPKVVEVANGSAPPVEIDFTAGITIRGRVTRNGVPAGGGNVFFAPRNRTQPRSAFGTIGPDGVYEVTGVEPGDYDVRVGTMSSGNDVVPYTVSGNAVFDIDLKGAPLRGVVLDAASGAPLPDVRVSASSTVQQPRVWRSAVSDTDGRFSLEVLPDGAYTLRAEREHYAPSTQTLNVSGGSAPPAELRLVRGQEAAVRIVDAESGAAMDGNVVLLDAQKKFSGNGSGRGDDGAVHIWASPGRYTAQVRANGYIMQSVDLSVPGAEVRVALPRAAGLVMTSRGGGKFRIVPPRPGGNIAVPMTIAVRPGERMPFYSLMPGVYEVDKLGDDGKSVTRQYTVVLTGGQTATLDAD